MILLKTLVQTYAKADELLGELDRLFASGVTVEQLVRTRPGERNLYAEFMSLRILKESIEEGIEQRFEVKFNEAIDAETSRVVVLDQLESQARTLMEEHPEHQLLIDLALGEIREHARVLHDGYLDGKIFEKAPRRFDVIRIRKVRKQIQEHPGDSIRAFAPQDGEAGIHVERFIKKIQPQTAGDLSAIFGAADRLPATAYGH
jgi:hypothetical protein